MKLFSDFKELSAWIIGLAALAALLIITYIRPRKGKIKT